MKKLLLSLGAIASVAAPVAAVIACTTEDSKGDGFKNASIIENFDINDESSGTKQINDYSIDGKQYDISDKVELKNFVDDWTESVNNDPGLSAKFETFKTMVSPSPSAILITSEIRGSEIILDLKDDKGNPLRSLQSSEFKTTIGEFQEKVNAGFLPSGSRGFDNLYIDWAKTHNFSAKQKTVKVSPKKNDSIDSIIYTQAQALPKSKVFKTEKDEVLIGKFNEGGAKEDAFKNQDNLNLRPYTAGNSGFYDLTSEFRAGDSLIFAFDNENDLASFTQRVKYDNTSDVRNSMPLDEVSVQNINYQGISVEGGKLIAKPVDDNSMGQNVSIFSLEVIDRNAVELTFNDMFDLTHHHIEAQLLYLFGFTDANKDGVTDSKDINMAGPFAVDNGTVYSNYINNPDGHTYIHKDTTIAGYKEVKDFLAKA